MTIDKKQSSIPSSKLSLRELIVKLESAVKTLSSQVNELNMPSRFEDLITRKQAARFLKIDQSTLHRWTDNGKLSALKLGNRVYYRLSEIEMILENSRSE